MLRTLILSSLIFCHSALALEITATVDKNPVMVDESFTLQVSADDDMDVSAFDPSPLMKDFVVGRTSVSRQTQMVNFNTTKITRWNTVLIPRKQGRYTIPALKVAGKTTQPINLMVIPVSASHQGQNRDLYVTTEVDTTKAYLQTQIRYTAKLYLAVDLQRGSLESPKIADADIRQIGKDKEYSDIVDGRRYRIIERTFAIIPQKSGKFTINGPLFEGEVIDNSNSNQSFGFFKRTKNVSRVGPAIDIEVLPVPDNYPDHWLPSDFVQLTEEWQPGPDEYKVGEPITRTISLTAVGLVEEQLPEINSQYPDEVKTYPDQAKTATVEQDGNLIAQRTETIAIIPNSDGKIKIPAVSVPWFNVVTGETEYARLPARTISVAAGAATKAVPATTTPVETLEPSSEPIPAQSTSNIIAPQQPIYWSISSTVLTVLWLLTLFLWWYTRRITQNAPAVSVHQNQRAVSNKQLNQILASNDPAAALPVITRWLADYCQKPNQSLAASQRQIADESLNQQISYMLSCLYAKQTAQWDGSKLLEIINQLAKQSSPVSDHPYKLEPLYPNRSIQTK
ncbi:BatD family protein [Neptunicella sp. SCSIO 80796]|uniref:BatD family protein n=1 Tax=Neptunicella plasticusilytica TaxID=3117012 RepID=UPI003A4DF6A3